MSNCTFRPAVPGDAWTIAASTALSRLAASQFTRRFTLPRRSRSSLAFITSMAAMGAPTPGLRRAPQGFGPPPELRRGGGALLPLRLPPGGLYQLAQPVVEGRLGDGRVAPLGQLGQGVLRVGQAQGGHLPELVGQGDEPPRTLQPPDGFHLDHSGFHRLVQVGGVAVHPAERPSG